MNIYSRRVYKIFHVPLDENMALLEQWVNERELEARPNGGFVSITPLTRDTLLVEYEYLSWPVESPGGEG